MSIGIPHDIHYMSESPSAHLGWRHARRMILTLVTFFVASLATVSSSSDAATSHKKISHHGKGSRASHAKNLAKRRQIARRTSRRPGARQSITHPRQKMLGATTGSRSSAISTPTKKAAIAAPAALAVASTQIDAAPPREKAPSDKGSQTGLPLPRFAALRADKVFFRRGPGQRYPIEWIYRRRGLPVKIEREFDVWRLIEDSDGVKAWVHQATLFSQRHFVVLSDGTEVSHDGPVDDAATPAHADPQIVGYQTETEMRAQSRILAKLYHSPDTQSRVVAVLRPGVVGRLRLCAAASDWCQVNVKGYKGWLERKDIWGLLPDEVLKPD